MVLWVVFAVLTAATVALVARPLLNVRRDTDGDAGAETEATLNIYRDQLAEIDRELARGLIGKAEADAARSEVARRLIACADAGRAGASPDAAGTVATARSISRKLALGVLGAVPLVAILLYARLGAPEVASQPHAARVAMRPEASRIEELIARVEARLAENPEDGAGWDVIAPIYLRLRRFDDAVNAYAHAIRLKGESIPRLSGIAEAAISGSREGVPDVAREAYERIVARDPSRLDARFWLAVAKEQAGRREDARADYQAILNASPAEAPWRAMVAERLKAVGGSVPAAPAATGGAPAPGGSVGARPGAGAAPGPSASDVAAAAKRSPDEQAAMIRGMVDGLADRLKADGRDAAGWQRLIRAYIVLGERDKAAAALAGARQALAGDAAGRDAVETAARQLGLAP
ncbi:MAG: c-type cytochrome biogenesis protein CcmI [Hyphomicrobiaceae bacterium]